MFCGRSILGRRRKRRADHFREKHLRVQIYGSCSVKRLLKLTMEECDIERHCKGVGAQDRLMNMLDDVVYVF